MRPLGVVYATGAFGSGELTSQDTINSQNLKHPANEAVAGFFFLRETRPKEAGPTKETKMTIEEAALENKLNELDILRQSLEDRDRRIQELEKKAEILENLLTRAASVRVQYPQPQAQKLAPAPKRWSVR